MSTMSDVKRAAASARAMPGTSEARQERARRRAMRITVGITIVSLALLVDLLLVGHTSGEQIWGPITAGLAGLTGGLSLTLQLVRGRNRATRWALYALFATVAFFGFGGYNDHRLLLRADAAGDQRQPPPLAPLMFTGMGIAGAVVLRYGTKGN